MQIRYSTRHPKSDEPASRRRTKCFEVSHSPSSTKLERPPFKLTHTWLHSPVLRAVVRFPRRRVRQAVYGERARIHEGLPRLHRTPQAPFPPSSGASEPSALIFLNELMVTGRDAPALTFPVLFSFPPRCSTCALSVRSQSASRTHARLCRITNTELINCVSSPTGRIDVRKGPDGKCEWRLISRVKLEPAKELTSISGLPDHRVHHEAGGQYSDRFRLDRVSPGDPEKREEQFNSRAGIALRSSFWSTGALTRGLTRLPPDCTSCPSTGRSRTASRSVWSLP